MKKGSVTIYFSMIMLSVMLLISTVLEAARVRATKAECASFVHLAADSVMAGYAKQLYEDYGVFLVWENRPVEETLKSNIQANINMADLNETGNGLMGTNLADIKVKKISYVTDEDGELFAKQLASYVKYAGAMKLVDSLKEKYEAYEKAEDSSNEIEQSNNADSMEDSEEQVSKLVEDIQDKVKDLKNISPLDKKIKLMQEAFEKLKDDISSHKKYKSFLKRYRKSMNELDDISNRIVETKNLISEYKIKKETILKQSGYTYGNRDYIEENMEILEKTENIINEVKELGVSEFSEVSSKNIDIVVFSIESIFEVKNKLNSLIINEATKEDEENKTFLEKAKELLQDGILSLVVDDPQKISNASIKVNSNLPSTTSKQNGKSPFLNKIKNKAVIAVYSNLKFGNYLNQGKDSPLKYEMEYILNGKLNDKENLTVTVEKITGLRNVINFVALAMDTEKMSELSMVASSAATAVGVPFLEPVFKLILMEAWALAESVYEVRTLIDGEKIPFVKNSSNWKTDLKSLGAKESGKKDKSGLSYVDYLQLLIMAHSDNNCLFRIMDLMQINIQKKYQPEFKMNKCLVSVSFESQFETKPLFTAIPWAMNPFQNGEDYHFCIEGNLEF